MKLKKILFGFSAFGLALTAAGCSADDTIKEQESKISELQAKLTEKEAEIAALEAKNTQSDATITSLEKDKTDAATKADSDEAQINELNSEIELLNKRIEMMKSGQYSISVVDWDGKTLGQKEFYVDEYATVYDALSANFDVEATDYSGSHYVTSVNNSLKDPGYYLSFYENGDFAMQGVDTIKIDKGDAFLLEVTPASYFDEYDKLVDECIYEYANNYMNTMLASYSSYSSSVYWEACAINMMAKYGYDTNIFNLNATTNTFKSSVADAKVSELTGNNLFKYGYVAKALGIDTTAFVSKYSEYLPTITSYSEYSTPMFLGCANIYGLADLVSNDIKKTTYRAGTTWGIDGLCWELTSLASFDTLAETELGSIEIAKDEGNNTTNASKLMALMSMNINIRDSKYENSDEKDLIEIIFDTYYDKTNKFMKYSKDDTEIKMSTNQIYAALMAYKVRRDLVNTNWSGKNNTAVSIFG